MTIKIYPASKMLFLREQYGPQHTYMGGNLWKHLGTRIYDKPKQIVEDGYYYGICRNFPENGMCLDVFEKCCSKKLVESIKGNVLSFAELVEIILIYQLKDEKGKFCAEGKVTPL